MTSHGFEQEKLDTISGFYLSDIYSREALSHPNLAIILRKPSKIDTRKYLFCRLSRNKRHHTLISPTDPKVRTTRNRFVEHGKQHPQESVSQ